MLALSMVEVVRTAEELLEGLPHFPFGACYRQLDGLRLAHIDEGEGRPVLFVHGEPTWSFLWRKVIPPVRDAGFRCIALDHAGFGRSDKPVDIDWYTYDKHTELAADLIERLDLRKTTIVVHDWGGPIGLRLAVEQQDRIARIVILDTGLFTGRQRMTDAWQAFHDFVRTTEDLPIGALIKGGCKHDPGAEVLAAYEAPYETATAKAGARAFPLIIPHQPEAQDAVTGRRVLNALKHDSRPTLMLWGEDDPVLPFSVGEQLAAAIGTEPPTPIAKASHFLQEDAGPQIGDFIAEWLSSE